MGQPSLFSPPSLSVSELTRYLRQLLESDELLQDVWATGEISNLRLPDSGHVYFTLKDSFAALRCVIWRSTAQRIGHALANGQAIEAHGAIGVYERDGQYQLYVDGVRPAGQGWLYQEFLRLKARLEAEGLFAPERKRPLPSLPRCIGIVTSPTGAALQDMLNTLRNRYPLAEVILAPTLVQGEEAPQQIAAALRALNQSALPDVILVARGGGSLEDLWAFNDERVVYAIADSHIPVVTGIGHETDFTLADFAADLRAPTPTGAAMLATPDAADLRFALQGTRASLIQVYRTVIRQYREQQQQAIQRLQYASPLYRVRNDRQRLDELYERLQRATQHRLQVLGTVQQSLGQRLESLNPSAILQRGYSIVRLPDGAVVRSVQQVRAGQALQINVADGDFPARVEDRP